MCGGPALNLAWTGTSHQIPAEQKYGEPRIGVSQSDHLFFFEKPIIFLGSQWLTAGLWQLQQPTVYSSPGGTCGAMPTAGI